MVEKNGNIEYVNVKETQHIVVDTHRFTTFTKEFICSGITISFTLTHPNDIKRRNSKASSSIGALSFLWISH